MNRKLYTLQQKIDALSKEIRENFEEALKEAANEIFEKYPKLERFSWVQYTPYFNDGEPCEFSIHADPGYVYNKFECERYESAISWKTKELRTDAVESFENKKEAEKLEKDLRDFVNDLCSFEHHVQSVLGEGEVIVTRDGVEVEDYEHD